MIKYDELKTNMITLLNPYVAPTQPTYEGSVDTVSYPSLKQSFIPFSTTISSVEIYVPTIIGSPDPVTASLLNSANATIITTSHTLSANWNVVSLYAGNLVTKDTHYLKIESGHSTIAYAYLGTSTVNVSEDTLYVGAVAQTFNMAFDINTPSSSTIVHRSFPRIEPAIETYPIITVDITGRSKINQRWLDPKRLEESITASFNIYSRYPSEIDLITRRIEKGMFRERKNLTDVFLISPGATSAISRFRDNIFNRQVGFNLYMIIQVE